MPGKVKNSKIAVYAREIQKLAKEIKQKHPNTPHRTAVKEAAKKLKTEGFFK